MNTKKVRLNGYHFGSPLGDPLSPQLPSVASKQCPVSAGLPSSFHQELANSAPRQQHSPGCRLHEEYTPWSVFAQSCVGSNNAEFHGAENLLGMAKFDCPLGMLLMPTAKTSCHSSENELYRPQLRDAVEPPPALKLPFPPPPPAQQQQEGAHGLFSNASTTRLLGGEQKTHSFSPHVAAPNPTLPAMEARSLQSQMENQLPESCIGAPMATTGNGDAPAAGPGAPRKTRIRWTQDLHERFVDCVNQLGGADKTTPRAILKLMDSDGVTIYHIKSHLQKYRMAKYMPGSSSAEGKQQEKRVAGNDMENLDLKIGMDITEALRIQLDMLSRLREQLKIQRDLELRIEIQGKKLQRMFEDQLKASRNVTEPQKLDDLFLMTERDDAQLLSVDGSSSSDDGLMSKI